MKMRCLPVAAVIVLALLAALAIVAAPAQGDALGAGCAALALATRGA